MLFDPLAQISEKIEDALKLGLEYNKNVQTKETFSIPHIANTRPDGTAVAKYALLLAGEEKPEDGTLQEALADLKAKFREPFSKLHYGVLPYIICYTASGKQVQFYSLQLDAITGVIHYNTPEGRAKVLHVVTNLYRLLLKMKETLPEPGGLALFEKVKRPSGAVVEAGFYSVKKTIRGAASFFETAGTSAEHVKAAYQVAKTTRFLVQAAQGPVVHRDVYLVEGKPLGCPAVVKSEEDVRRLVHDLLHGLDKLHTANICHRDIQQPNVISCLDASNSLARYILIDLESAAPAGASLPAVHYDAWEDETLVGGRYVAESDLYQLAKMVQITARSGAVELSEDARALLKELRGKQRSASSLLQENWVSCKCGQGLAV
ncbi:Hypothetical protein KFL_001630140 [Klebsormidium nitens]|uniref:Protein kinase domain-containing protein n=1 Tax=Klebsormidium nitens TaxID=105231 RepID=A0A1Y1I536_KLENI|nr:Hypothetical protein KFL_001630140 [Klebsormidium nitens]|eukprot:GAQ83816.1 Hypothetical protein KFL_001630140 [Klebsormidium nitens]